MDGINVIRNFHGEDNPPDELYEGTWRDAMKVLEDGGVDSGFILMVVKSNNGADTQEAKFVTSPGRIGAPLDGMVQVLAEFIKSVA